MQNKVKGLFFLEKGPFHYVMFGGSRYFLKKRVNKLFFLDRDLSSFIAVNMFLSPGVI